MDQGLVTNPKDLERMQHELVSLERRITTLEDDELEVMERLEEAQQELDELTAQLADADARIAELDESRDAKPPRSTPSSPGSPSSAARSAAGCRRTCGALRAAARAARAAWAPPRCAPASAAAAARPRHRRARRDPGRGRGRGDPLRGVPADPGPHGRVRSVSSSRDRSRPHRGRRGSRGNPGPAAYGAVLKDAETGEVIAEDGTTIGVATNNVAEYRGLIAGLRLAAELAPEADIEVRMDSKLVVEQMSRQLEDQAPRHEAAGARGQPAGAVRHDVHLGAARAEQARRPARQRGAGRQAGRRHRRPARRAGRPADRGGRRARGRADAELRPRLVAAGGPPTTLILVRHGVTAHTSEKRFSGGLASANPGLTDEGRAQIRATAEWLAPLAERVDVVVASPVRRTRESARDPRRACSASRSSEEPGFAEMEFGTWDGLTFAEVAEQHPDGARRLARARSTSRRAAASRSGRSRSGCSRRSNGCSRRTPARPSSWSAT